MVPVFPCICLLTSASLFGAAVPAVGPLHLVGHRSPVRWNTSSLHPPPSARTPDLVRTALRDPHPAGPGRSGSRCRAGIQRWMAWHRLGRSAGGTSSPAHVCCRQSQARGIHPWDSFETSSREISLAVWPWGGPPCSTSETGTVQSCSQRRAA